MYLFPEMSELGFFKRGCKSVYRKAGKGGKPALVGYLLWARQFKYMILFSSQHNPDKVGILFLFHR